MATKQQLEDRRRQVWDLVLRGVPVTVIAKTLGVHRNTITNDVKVLRERNRQQITDVDVKAEIGDAVAKYDEIFKAALGDYATTDKDGSKASFLSQAQSALERKLRFLIDVGVLPKAVQEFSGKLVVEGVDVASASVDELKSLRNKLAQRAGVEVRN